MKRPAWIFAAALVASTPQLAHADGSYNNYSLGKDNVIVSGSVTSQNEVEGATVVGGNFTVPGNATQYAIKINQPSATTDTFVVGGTINGGSGITVDAGVTRYGVAATNVHDNSNVPPIKDPSLVAGTNVANGLGTNLNTYLTGLSNGFQAPATTNTVAQPTYTVLTNGNPTTLSDQNGKLTFNVVAAANGVAVLNIDASLFNSNTYKGQGLGYTVVNNGNVLKDIVFNVTGTTVNLNVNSGFASSFVNSALNAETIFNSYQATSITSTSGFGYFYGALLASHATYTNNADNQGSVYVANFVHNSEVHLALVGQHLDAAGLRGLHPHRRGRARALVLAALRRRRPCRPGPRQGPPQGWHPPKLMKTPGRPSASRPRAHGGGST